MEGRRREGNKYKRRGGSGVGDEKVGRVHSGVRRDGGRGGRESLDGTRDGGVGGII